MGIFERFDSMRIRTKLIIVVMFLVIVPLLLLGTLTYYSTKAKMHEDTVEQLTMQVMFIKEKYDMMYEQGKQKLSHDLKLAEEMLSDHGFFTITGQGMLALEKDDKTQTLLNENTGILNKIESITESDIIIFQKKDDGLYPIITALSRNNTEGYADKKLGQDIADHVLDGETYTIRIKENDANYLATYKPIYSETGTVIGVICARLDEKGLFSEVNDFVSNIKVGETGYIYILDSEGRYVLSKDRARDGELIIDSKDKNGKYFIKEIIEAAKGLDEDMVSSIRYSWQNQGEKKPREKIAVFGYYRPMDMVIASGSYMDEFNRSTGQVKLITAIIILGAALLSFTFLYFFANYFSTPIEKLAFAFTRLSEHDYTYKLDVTARGKNEIGKLVRAYNDVVSSTKDILKKILKNMENVEGTANKLSASSEEVSSSTQQVSLTIQEIAKGAQTQSRDVVKTAEVIKELGEQIAKVSVEIKSVSESTALANKNAIKGKESAGYATENIKKIQDIFTDTTKIIGLLEQKSQEIGKIVDVINNISEQTNLLALNATIEAARAGEAGKGFSVVADEIRKLAEESQKATHQITDLILDIQNSTNNAVKSINSGSAGVQEGSKVVGDALVSLEGISAIINNIDAQTKNIVSLSNNQEAYTQDVDKSIADVSAIAQESAAGAEEVSASIEQTNAAVQDLASTALDMRKNAEELREDLSKFKIEDNEIENKK